MPDRAHAPLPEPPSEVQAAIHAQDSVRATRWGARVVGVVRAYRPLLVLVLLGRLCWSVMRGGVQASGANPESSLPVQLASTAAVAAALWIVLHLLRRRRTAALARAWRRGQVYTGHTEMRTLVLGLALPRLGRRRGPSVPLRVVAWHDARGPQWTPAPAHMAATPAANLRVYVHEGCPPLVLPGLAEDAVADPVLDAVDGVVAHTADEAVADTPAEAAADTAPNRVDTASPEARAARDAFLARRPTLKDVRRAAWCTHRHLIHGPRWMRGLPVAGVCVLVLALWSMAMLSGRLPSAPTHQGDPWFRLSLVVMLATLLVGTAATIYGRLHARRSAARHIRALLEHGAVALGTQVKAPAPDDLAGRPAVHFTTARGEPCRLELPHTIPRKLARHERPWLVVHDPKVPAHVLLIPVGAVTGG